MSDKAFDHRPQLCRSHFLLFTKRRVHSNSVAFLPNVVGIIGAKSTHKRHCAGKKGEEQSRVSFLMSCLSMTTPFKPLLITPTLKLPRREEEEN